LRPVVEVTTSLGEDAGTTTGENFEDPRLAFPSSSDTNVPTLPFVSPPTELGTKDVELKERPEPGSESRPDPNPDLNPTTYPDPTLDPNPNPYPDPNPYSYPDPNPGQQWELTQPHGHT
jgi:hypothetical protein